MEAIHRLCVTVKANRHVENCQELSNSLEQLIQASGINASKEGDIASARMRLKEGIKLNKEIYSDLEDAQTNAREITSKFSYIKAVQVFVKLSRIEGEIGDSSGFYYSDEYQEACKACISQTRDIIREQGALAVPKLRCDITQLSQFKTTYKKVIDILNRQGFSELAFAIQDRLATVENELVTTQKYKQSIDDVNYFLQTTRINTSSSRLECVRASENAAKWIQYWESTEDFPTDKRANYLERLRTILESCSTRLSEMDKQFQMALDAEKNATSESDLTQITKIIDRLKTFGMTEEQEGRIAEIEDAINQYTNYWTDRVINRFNFEETIEEIRQVFYRVPYCSLALQRMEKLDQQIRKDAKSWMQKNVLGYAKKLCNMPVSDALQLQRVLEKLPDCLDEDDLLTVENYRSLVAERIKLARVEAIEIMFKELDIEEKTRCLDNLKKIMDKGLKQSAMGRGNLKSPRFTDEELILLLHCYLRHREEWFTSKSLHVNELSRLYRDIPIHSMEERLSPTFRNPAGIDMQIRTLAKCDPTDDHHQKLNPSLDMVRIWEEYGENLGALEDQVNKIIFKYGINTKEYPTLFM